MKRIDAAGAAVHALTDCAPPPAPCSRAFPDAELAANPQAARWFPEGEFRTQFTAFLVQTAGRTLLVDCGLGPGPVAYFPGLAGRLDAGLAAIGVAPEQVDAVVFTHLHVDHVGWAVRADGSPTFPRARYCVAASEWAHWSANGEAAGLPHHVQAVRRCIVKLHEAGRLECLREGDAPVPGVALLATEGHTPGHHSVLLGGGAAALLIAGDLWHNPAQIAEPDWCHRADMDRIRAIATRRRMIDFAARTGCLVAAGHFLEPFGRIECRGGACAFVPLQAMPHAGADAGSNQAAHGEG